jgi:mRNA export factor
MSGIFGAAAASSTTQTAQGDLTKDVEVANPPEDTVSDIAFSPTQDMLAASSWDKKVRIYEINAQGQSQGKHMYEHDAPVFSVDWSKVRDI